MSSQIPRSVIYSFFDRMAFSDKLYFRTIIDDRLIEMNNITNKIIRAVAYSGAEVAAE